MPASANVRAACHTCKGVPRARVHFDVNPDEGNALEGCDISWNCCGRRWPVADGEVEQWCRVYLKQKQDQRDGG